MTRKTSMILIVCVFLITGCSQRFKHPTSGSLAYKGKGTNWVVELKVNYSKEDTLVKVNEEVILKYLGKDLKSGANIISEYNGFSGTGKSITESLLTEEGLVHAGGGGHIERNFKIPTGRENVTFTIKWNDNSEEKITAVLE